MFLNYKEINKKSLEIAGVDMRDYPDFCDAYFDYAEFIDGTPLSDDELEQLTDSFRDILNEYAADSIYH